MVSPAKYFVFNKETDFLRGSWENIAFLSPGIRISNVDVAKGIYFSRLLDTREKKMKWHRLLVERAFTSKEAFKLKIYVSDVRYLEYEGKNYDIGEVLSDNSIPIGLKQQMFEQFLAKTFDDPEDALLFDIEGRYLWFQILLTSQNGISPEITKIKLFFPKNTWMEYLPEVYQANPKSASFVERFLGIFQTIYQDMTQQIDSVAKFFDANSVNEEILRWLAEWMAIDDSYVWTEENLRYLVANALYLYSMRGTVDYLEKMVKLYTGRTPYIIEHHQLEPFLTGNKRADLITELYGDNKYIFTVIVDMEAIVSNKEFKILTKIIDSSKPAHMESNLIVLEPFIFLDQHSYLGINSVLGQYHDFVLDGQAAISFTTIS